MRRPCARQTADDDRRLDLQVVDLGVAAQHVVDHQAVAEQLGELHEHGGPTRGAERDVLGERLAQDVEAFAKAHVAEVVEPRLLDGGGHEEVGFDGDGCAHLGHRLADRGHFIGVQRRREVVDGDGRRPCGGHQSVTTSVVGRSGVADGWNQRNQRSPRGCPAVDSQLACPGSRPATTIVQEPSSS